MLFQFAVALAALFVPYILWSWSRKTAVGVYEGPATVIHTPIIRREEYDFVHVEIPRHESMILEIDKARRAKLTGIASNVNITVKRQMFGKNRITNIVWPGECAPEADASTKFDGIYLTAAYLMLGLGAAVYSTGALGPVAALTGHIGLYFSALLLAVSGFVMNKYLQKGKIDRSKFSAKFLIFPLGKGLLAMYMMLAITGLLTAVSFWYGGLLILIPGMHAAMGLGGIISLLMRANEPEAPVTQAC